MVGGHAVAAAEGLGCAFGDDAPVGEDGDPVGQVLGLVHVVGGQEDRLAELAEPGDDLPGGPAGRRIETGGRLVQEDDLGVADQGQGDIEAPALAAGQLRGERVRLLGQADQGDGVVDVARRPVVAGIQLQALAHGQAGLGLGLLQHDADPVPPRPRRLAGSTPSTRHRRRCGRGTLRGSRRWSSCRRRWGRGRRRSRPGGRRGRCRAPPRGARSA